tara:strand:- start:2485 stop:2712 length:228 start_codon:yes stop_codon:yes gene_type:complete
MTVLDKGTINFLTNGEEHDSSSYNRPIDDLADAIQVGFDSIDQDIVDANQRITDQINYINNEIAAELDAINGEVI